MHHAKNASSREFLAAFAIAANLTYQQADEQWSGASRNISDYSRDQIEAGGAEAGDREGLVWRSMFDCQ